MTPEKLHRKKLKEIGYVDEAIEEIVFDFNKKGKYGFVEKYHEEILKESDINGENYLPKQLSNEAYRKANEMTYEEFVGWWDKQKI